MIAEPDKALHPTAMKRSGSRKKGLGCCSSPDCHLERRIEAGYAGDRVKSANCIMDDQMQSPPQVDEFASIVDLKNLARTLLPSSSELRDLILSEPDYLPNDVTDT